MIGRIGPMSPMRLIGQIGSIKSSWPYQIRNPNHLGLDDSGLSNLAIELRSTDKHLILGVGLVYGLWHWRNENLEATSEARHNSGNLPSRLNNLRLNEVGC